MVFYKNMQRTLEKGFVEVEVLYSCAFVKVHLLFRYVLRVLLS